MIGQIAIFVIVFAKNVANAIHQLEDKTAVAVEILTTNALNLKENAFYSAVSGV